MRFAKTALGIAVLGSLLFSGLRPLGPPLQPGFHQHFRHSGWYGRKGTIVVTGAIGDFGKTLTINQNGTTMPTATTSRSR